MDAADNILLDEDALLRVANDKRPLFVLRWLCFLDKALPTTPKTQIKECQKKLVDQLLLQIQNSPGPPVRQLLARCLATTFGVGDTFLLFEAVNFCNDILKNRDDSPSFLPTKLAAITCIGVMYQNLGRLMGRSYEETISHLLKSLKSAESQTRVSIYICLEMIVSGLGSVASSTHRDIFKALRHGLIDRVMAVRVASAGCLREMVKHAPFLYTTDLESVFSLCFRSLEGSSYEVRLAMSQVLAGLIYATQKNRNATSHPSPGHAVSGSNGGGKIISSSATSSSSTRQVSIEEVMSLMSSGFLKGGLGFLKTSTATDMIKGSNVGREVRLGVAHGYSLLIHTMGTVWFESNLTFLLSHLLELLSHPKASSSHAEAVFLRSCVFHVITSSVKKLSEKSQGQVVKEIVKILVKNTPPPPTSSNTSSSGDVAHSDTESLAAQHLLICALESAGFIIEGLGTTCHSLLSDSTTGVIDAILALVIHPSAAVRLSASWTLRCIGLACPSFLTPLIDRCIESLEASSTSGTCVSGYSSALAALLGVAHQTPLGIPHKKGKMVFNLAEDMLRSTTQNSRLSLQRTQSGWLLMGAVVTLGPSVVRSLLQRLLLLWKNSFPRSPKDLESEKSRGDAFTWQVTLENRSGALAVMKSLMVHCRVLVTEEVIRRLITPIDAAITMLSSLATTLKSFGPSVKAAATATKLRLFQVLLLIPSSLFESSSLPSLLKLLVSEITLIDSVSNSTSSLLRSIVSSSDDEVLLGSWIHRTDHFKIEDQVNPNSMGLEALEHDSTTIYREAHNGKYKGPLPLGVSIIDKSCLIFGHIFPYVHQKHRAQLLNHLNECVKQAKASRQEAIQVNTVAAVYCAVKALTESKAALGSEEVRNPIVSFLISLLSHSNMVIRAAAAQTLGRLGILLEGKTLSELAASLFEKLKSSRDANTRTGISLALGCLHRQVGSLGSHQHVNTAIGMLLTLTHDSSSPIVQSWSLHAMSLVAETGPSFRTYADPALTQSLRLLMSVSDLNFEVHQSIGKLLTSVIVTVGPELQIDSESLKTARDSLFLACSIMQNHRHPLVQTSAISCLQQMHMFSPQHLDLELILPTLCDGLESPHMFLRRVSLSFLHQLIQREASKVHDLVLNHVQNSSPSRNNPFPSRIRSILSTEQIGLPALLFCLLDTEIDREMQEMIEKVLSEAASSLASHSLLPWISLCKEVLTSTDTTSELSSPDKDPDGDDFDFVADDSTFRRRIEIANPNSFGPPKWRTRVFATQLLRTIIHACSSSSVHFNLSLAREQSHLSKDDSEFLVFHVSDLIRMSFIAATSESDQLRLEGLETLQLVIDKFCKVPEPEFPDHVILEQFQAQVGAALRPAFSSETSSHVTATACEVCSAWIGSGVARDLNDLRRVHQLLVSSLAKLNRDHGSGLQYNESALTMEKLAILRAWAEVYAVAMDQEKEMQDRILHRSKHKPNEDDDDEEDYYEEDLEPQESLLQLVSPELENLANHWLSALKDHALLTLPSEFSDQLPHDGGAFFSSDTIELARPHYRKAWPPILHAAAIWLCSHGFKVSNETEGEGKDIVSHKTLFHLMFGICLESLCTPRSSVPLSHIIVCLKSLRTLFQHSLPQKVIVEDVNVTAELCHVLHRLLLTKESIECQRLIMEISKNIMSSDQSISDDEDHPHPFASSESTVLSFLDICLCVLVRQLPQLSPSLTNFQSEGKTPVIGTDKRKTLTDESGELVSLSLDALSSLPLISSKESSLNILPVVLFLMTGVLRETCNISSVHPLLTSSLNRNFDKLCSCPRARHPETTEKWIQILRSTLSLILDYSKTGGDNELRLDMETTVMVVSTFISKSPAQVARDLHLQFPTINLLTHYLQSDQDNVQMSCLQALKTIFTTEDKTISLPFIHSLGPRVFELVSTSSDCSDSKPLLKEKLQTLLECLEVIEVLLSMAESKIDILSLYLPILVSFLLEDPNTLRSKSCRSTLHQHALSKLVVIAPQYPGEFKNLMEQVPVLKRKLENALRNQQIKSHMASSTMSHPSSLAKSSVDQPHPVIQLKTDFSHFK